MIGIVVVTHGQLATELLNAAEMIVGDLPRFKAVSIGWHEDTEDARQEIAEAIAGVQQGQGVLILTDMGLASRIEAFDEPDLPKLMVNPKADLSPRGADFKPYPLDRLTRHAPPGSRIESGKYPTVTGLEHDELGHPTGSPKLHQQMTVKRREKIKQLAASLPPSELTGDSAGELLLVTWGSSWGPGREALGRVRNAGVKAGHMHLRHVHPLPNGLAEIFARYHKVVVAELNDEGLYGYGQLAMMLRASLALPHIVSVTKTDGLTFKVSEIVAGIARHIESTALDASLGVARQSALAQG